MHYIISKYKSTYNYLKGKPLVSICCITYNHEPYIRDCLEGFMMQKTSFPFEILIHDDASTDHTAEIIREYESQYPDIIKPIYQNINQFSKGKTINGEYNFPRVRGKYIAMCEGDDYWTDPLKLQKQFDFLESHPDYSLCCHNALVIDERNNRTYDFYKIYQECDFCLKTIIINKNGLMRTASMFFRSELASEFPKYKMNCPVGDQALVICMANNGKVHYFSEKMSVYRFGSSGSWTSCQRSSIASRYNTDCSFIKWFEQLKAFVPEKEALDIRISRTYISKCLYGKYYRGYRNKYSKQLYKRLSASGKIYYFLFFIILFFISKNNSTNIVGMVNHYFVHKILSKDRIPY